MTACPSRILAEDDGDAIETVLWWLDSTRFEQGRPSGPPEWPRKGGRVNQAAKLLEACDLIQAEFHYLPKPEKKVAG